MAKIVRAWENDKVNYHRVVKVLDSENIDEIRYNVDSEQMMISFTNNTKYEYYDIPCHVFGAIVIADSVGSCFNELVKNKSNLYTYRKVI